jgi:signal transduction histidine kinase
MLTRRDLKRIEQLIRQAQKISSGNYDIDIRLTGRSSEIDRLNDSLIRMAESLTSTVTLERELQHRMKEFVADASHELRTPLTIIKGYFELLSTQQGSSSELEQKGAKRISNQIQRMQNLVDDLLLLAELDREVEDDFDVVDLSERLQNALNDLNALKNHPSLRVNVPPNIRIKADDRLIDQLLGNLISNVSRYVPENETLQVTLAAERAFAVLTFDDSGPGLPSKAYGQPIQRFTRFDNSRSRELGGSGLGLSIMSAIVQKHSGHLIMKASDLGGLHTTIRLPLALND